MTAPAPTFDLTTVGTLDGDALDVLCQLLIDLDAELDHHPAPAEPTAEEAKDGKDSE